MFIIIATNKYLLNNEFSLKFSIECIYSSLGFCSIWHLRYVIMLDKKTIVDEFVPTNGLHVDYIHAGFATFEKKYNHPQIKSLGKPQRKFFFFKWPGQ